MNLFRTLLLALALVTCACTPKTTIRHAPNFEAVLEKQRNVLILPPTAQIHEVGAFGGKKRLYNYEAEFESLAAEEATIDMKERGFSVKYLRRKEIDEAGAYDAFNRLRNSYDEARRGLYSPLLWEEPKAFALSSNTGPAAAELGQKTMSDLIVMVDYEGAVKTNGARTLEFATTLLAGRSSGEAADASMLIIGIVDAKSGDILWTNMSVDERDLYRSAFDNLSSQKSTDSKKLEKLIDRIFEPLKKSR
jgi:hypothetical protein